MEQIALWDIYPKKFPYAKPDYQGKRDEIVRYSIEREFTAKIKLKECSFCKIPPKEMFRSCREYFVLCPKCSKRTVMLKHLYEAKQEWNRKN